MLLKKIIVILSTILLMCSCQIQNTEINGVPVTEVTGEFSVSVLKVGQADAIILKTQNHTAVIDCGESDDGKEIVKKLNEIGTEYIDYLFITHFDKDHIGGVPEVLDKIPVGEIVVPDYESNSDEYGAYLNKIHELQLSPNVLTENMSFILDDVSFAVFPPLEKFYAQGDNDYSLVISVVHGENKFLFTGDAEKERLAELYSQLDLEHTFLKMPHHGMYSKGTKEFMQSVKPKYTVITCSEKNPADEKTLDAVEETGSEVYYTSNGDVTAVSDGKELKISQ